MADAADAPAAGIFARFALLRVLAHQPFALLWAGQALSRIGNYLYEIALAWWVLQKTGSALAHPRIRGLD